MFPFISQSFEFILQIAIGIVGMSFLVFIHEGGHFAVAKLLGVKVHTFSVGFGKTLWSFKKGDTEYCLKAIPFGGFVAMSGEQPQDWKEGEEKPKQDPRDFSAKSVPARIAIALAGPAVNILFAFFLLTALYMVGIEEPVTDQVIVGQVATDSPAEEAGVKIGDKIVALNNKPISSVQEFETSVGMNGTDPLILQILRPSKENPAVESEKNIAITPQLHELGMAYIGVLPNAISIQVGKVFPGSPAEKAGLKIGDKLLSINQKPITSGGMFKKEVQDSRGQAIPIAIKRGEENIEVAVNPKLTENESSDVKEWLIGIHMQPTYSQYQVVHRGLGESLVKSYETNKSYSLVIFTTLQKILRGSIPLQSLSGPVGIMQVIGTSFRANVKKFVELLAMISLNLGIMNLLPLIITDGGLVLFLLLEAIRRKPLSVNTQMRINQVAIALFITLALFITFHDVLRIPLFLN
jgi:regulator of sigma E protease